MILTYYLTIEAVLCARNSFRVKCFVACKVNMLPFQLIEAFDLFFFKFQEEFIFTVHGKIFYSSMLTALTEFPVQSVAKVVLIWFSLAAGRKALEGHPREQDGQHKEL